MVCIAAFIILAIIALFVPIYSAIFKKDARKFWKIFKKAWYCIGKKVRLQKCETGFKDDVKNTILAKVLMKNPKLVKPIGAVIETVAVLIVVIAIWSLLTVVKSSLALYVYGTCDVASPSSCSLDASESCSIDSEHLGFFESIGQLKLHVYIGNWFGEFGEVVAAVPARVKHWDASEYISKDANYYNKYDSGKESSLDIFDPGCIVCRQSYINQLNSGFFDKYNVAMLVYPIGAVDGGYKFKNSYIIARYITAVRLYDLDNHDRSPDWMIVHKLFTEYDEKGRQYQDAFNFSYSADEAERVLQDWLEEFGFDSIEVDKVIEESNSDKVKAEISANVDVVNNNIKTKKIPTTIYNGKRHSGLFKP
jgi:hypothetical protein